MPLVRWIVTRIDAITDKPTEWQLVVGHGKKQRAVATVWRGNGNYATWHTFDRDGSGGENDVEQADTQNRACHRAKVEAAASAIAQGFI